MAKKRKEPEIPRPKEDVKIEKGEPKFNAALSAFVKPKPRKDGDEETK